MAKGLFIVLEGIDGSGTTTQARWLAAWVETRGREVVLTAEPTGRAVGTIIRQILQGRPADGAGGAVEADEVMMALLFAADRADHMQNVVLPALDAGRVVVSDRHYLSSVAYQAIGVEMGWVEMLNARFRRPDLTVLLDTDPEVSLRRKHAQGRPAERYERAHALERVRGNYIEAVAHARAAGERIEILDGAPPPDAVHAAIIALVERLLGGET